MPGQGLYLPAFSTPCLRSLRFLLPGTPLVLRREPDNPYDEHAILFLTEAGEKLGYIPRDRNEIPARLMDAGKSLFSRLDSKEWHGDWLEISARIFLKDL